MQLAGVKAVLKDISAEIKTKFLLLRGDCNDGIFGQSLGGKKQTFNQFAPKVSAL